VLESHRGCSICVGISKGTTVLRNTELIQIKEVIAAGQTNHQGIEDFWISQC
jgi:hypothetical protein